PWDAGMRHIIAFLLAPYAAPAILAVYYASISGYRPETNELLYGALFAAYAGAIVFGIPIYVFLRTWRLTAFWIAPVVGFLVGTIMWYALVALFWKIFGRSPLFASSPLVSPEMAFDALRLGGVLGAAVGIILWLIGRPDRQRKAGN